MFRFTTRTALVALTAIAALALPASALATNVTEWYLPQTNNPGLDNNAPYAGVPTDLDNPYVPPPDGGQSPYGNGGAESIYGFGEFPELLVVGGSQLGSSPIDLTFDAVEPSGDFNPTAGGEWEFIRQPGHYVTQQIAASAHVALYDSTKGKYLVRGYQTFGISLVWSNTPKYQWQVAKGSRSDYPGLADLYNDAEKGGAYLIYHSTTFGLGPTLGWIHAPFETGPGYIPPKLPVTTSQQGNVAPPLPIKAP